MLPQSNLNLDDQSIDNSDYSIKLKLDGEYFIVSNLENILNEDNEREKAQLIGSSVKDVKLNILAEDNFIELKNNQFEVETDIFKKFEWNLSIIQCKKTKITIFISTK